MIRLKESHLRKSTVARIVFPLALEKRNSMLQYEVFAFRWPRYGYAALAEIEWLPNGPESQDKQVTC